MRYILLKKLISVSLIFLFCLSSSHAGVNPFKKTKHYSFGDDINWYESDGEAIKSGKVRESSDVYYYHLKVNKARLLLRLGKNDPSGQLENTRTLDALAIIDVKVDGKRLPAFNWCIQNQQDFANKLKQNAVVANDACINSQGRGDFIIFLDEETRQILQQASLMEFVIEPYGRTILLSYSMQGFSAVMRKINPPIAIQPVLESKQKSPAKVIAKPVVKPKSKSKPKPKPKPKPIKMCKAEPPADFSSIVSAIAYPCNQGKKKSAAESKINNQVELEKKKIAAQLIADEEVRRVKKRVHEDEIRDAQWQKKQNSLWLKRCKRHWDKGKSPCYCEKVFEQAPAGVVNSCEK